MIEQDCGKPLQVGCDVCGRLPGIVGSGISVFTFNVTPVWPQYGITCFTRIARGMTRLSVDVKLP